MNMKLSIIVTTLAMGFAAQANADCITSPTTSGCIQTNLGFGDNLVLAVWDPTLQESYTRNLMVTGNQILSNANVNFGTVSKSSAAVITGSDVAANASLLTVAADANMAQFLKNTSGDQLSWNVTTGDTTAGNHYGQNGLIVTSAVTPTFTLNSTENAANIVFGSGGTMVDVNQYIVPPVESTIISNANDPTGYAGGPHSGNNMNAGLTFSDTNPLGTSLGTSLNLYTLTPGTGTRNYNNGYMPFFEFANKNGASKFTLATNGNLTYTVAAATVSAVPEPGQWLLMVLGLGFVSLFSKSRRS